MARNKKSRKKPGLPPGSVVFTGHQKTEKIFVHYLHYNTEKNEETLIDNFNRSFYNQPSSDHIKWFDIRGLHDTELIEYLGKVYAIHPLILEDIANIDQRPKFEEYDKGIFFIIRALTFEKEICEVKAEQIAIYFTKGLLISFQEFSNDSFEVIRLRLDNDRGKIRQRNTDYLAYAMLDSIVDSYYIILDEIEIKIEELEAGLLHEPNQKFKGQVHHLKKELMVVRKSIAPLREAIGQWLRSGSRFIEPDTAIFMRDLYDHTVQIMDMVENYRDNLTSLQDLFLSEISYKMNQIMKVLTLITTIFVPLSFLASLYGMNFDNMPELHTKYGYFVLLGIMFTVAGSLVYWFNKNKWL